MVPVFFFIHRWKDMAVDSIINVCLFWRNIYANWWKVTIVVFNLFVLLFQSYGMYSKRRNSSAILNVFVRQHGINKDLLIQIQQYNMSKCNTRFAILLLLPLLLLNLLHHNHALSPTTPYSRIQSIFRDTQNSRWQTSKCWFTLQRRVCKYVF